METPTTSKWKSWEVFLTRVLAVIGAISIIIGTVKGGAELKEIFWANPQILNAQNCTCIVSASGEAIDFELLVNNPGSKNCSVIEVNLIWPDGLAANLDPDRGTSLPKTILPSSSETLKIRGWGHKTHRASATDWSLIPEGKLVLKPNQTSVEATALVKFNTGHIAKKKIAFIVVRN
jgi:hypothetical protein